MNRKIGRGRPPFGYDKYGNPIEKELEALSEIQKFVEQESISLREASEMVALKNRLERGVYLDGREENSEETRP